MIFLIEYDRPAGKTVTMREFADAQAEEAARARLARELELHRDGIEHEVVLLEAKSREALMLTHDRYFRTFRELIEAAAAEIAADIS